MLQSHFNFASKEAANEKTFKPLDLSKVSDKEILWRMDSLFQNERKLTHLILWHLNEVELRKLYFQVNCTSLFEYLTKHQGFSGSWACERVNATRLLRKIPDVTTKLERGEINLSQMSKIEGALKQNKKLGRDHSQAEEKNKARQIIDQVKNLTLDETAQVLAKELDLPVKTKQKKTPQKDESVRLELTLTKSQFEIFQDAQNLFSHSVPDRNLADSIEFLAKFFVSKKRGVSKQANSPAPPPTPETGVKRKHIPLEIQRLVFARAEHSCEFKDPKSKKRCGSKHQLQIDHRIPWSISQDDSAKNLRVLCAAHNLIEAKRWGLEK